MKLFQQHCSCEERIKSLENTITKVITSLEKTNDMFYKMVAKIQVEHMKQLDGQSDKFMELLGNKKQQEKEMAQAETFHKISTLDQGEPNSIEKEEHVDDPLVDFSQVPIADIANVQFEGEEEIMPISIN